MVLALVLTAASLTIGAAGVFLTDCASPALGYLGNDPIQLCAAVSDIGMEPQPWMGISLVAIAVLGLVAAWAPIKGRRARNADLRSISALQKNLNRVKVLPEQEVEEAKPEVGPEPDSLAALQGLVSDLKTGFESEDWSRDDLIETWVATIRICNELHNAGEIETTDFKKINTRLLDLVKPEMWVRESRELSVG